MRSKIDAKIERSGKQKRYAARKLTSPPGGKALQRLISYLGQRDPALNDEVLAAVPLPKTARPAFGLTTTALRAKPAGARAVKPRRGRKAAPAAKSFAAAIVKAAAALAAAAPAVAAPAPAWQFSDHPLSPTGRPMGTTRSP